MSINKIVNFAKPWLLFLVALGLGQFIDALPTAPLPPTTLQKTKSIPASDYGPPTQLAVLNDSSVRESSGLAASRSVPGLYWTHNDSGDGPFIYAFDTRGVRKGVWRLAGASAYDWEDMAAGPGPLSGKNYLYIGDIGDNQEKRSEITVYRVPEPVISVQSAVKGKNSLTDPADVIRLRYPDGAHDAETLLVHPVTGNVYIVTKIPFANPGIYEAAAPLNPGKTITLARIGTLEVPSLLGGIITGGAISPDGRRVAVCDYLQGYEAVLANMKSTFNEIWKRPLRPISLGSRKQGEAITYRLDSKALLATSEGSPMPLLQVVRR